MGNYWTDGRNIRLRRRTFVGGTAAAIAGAAGLAAVGCGALTTQIEPDKSFYPAEAYHQQYLAKPGSRPYCSAQPSGVLLGPFVGASYRLPTAVWRSYDWSVAHCVLRGENAPIALP